MFWGANQPATSTLTEARQILHCAWLWKYALTAESAQTPSCTGYMTWAGGKVNSKALYMHNQTVLSSTKEVNCFVIPVAIYVVQIPNVSLAT